jgi:hypothetical protein
VKKNNIDWVIAGIGITEIVIGSIAFFTLLISLVFHTSTKPWEVALFVVTTAAISAGLGIGLLRHSLACYNLLIFFSQVIIISKIAIFLKVISLNGALETTIPSGIKNIISIVYHGILIWYLKIYLKKQVCKKARE